MRGQIQDILLMVLMFLAIIWLLRQLGWLTW